MSAELGETTDPVALVPGSESGIVDLVWALRQYGDSLVEAGDGLKRIDTDAGWRGEAADAFREAYSSQPSRWLTAGDSFHVAANSLDGYANTLGWAQRQAESAISLYSQGDQQTAEAERFYAEHGGTGPFTDPGEATRNSARELLTSARNQLNSAGSDAAGAIEAAFKDAPEEPGFWDKVGDGLADVGKTVLHGAQDVGVAVINGLASYGNAMINNPADTAMMVGGLALMVVSGTAEGGGLALDATGVGAVVGVPINIVAAAGLATGAAAVAAGASSLAMHASSDDRVEPLKGRSEEPQPQGKRGTPTDRHKEHLTQRDLEAAQRELNGETVATKSNGTPWDHVNEVRNSQRGLINRIEQLKRMLGDSRLSEAQQAAAQSELSEASRLLEYSKRYVPR